MPGADDAVEHAGEDDHAAIGVVPRVEDQRLQGRLGLALRRGQPLHDRFENLVDAGAFLGARQNRAAGVEADDLLDLPLGFVRLRARQIDLVDHRDDFEAVVHREVGVGEGLRFDALRRVDEEQRPFAGGERAGHFVREVDVPGRVDQVEDVDLAVVGLVGQADGVGLDGDAPLAFEVHRVEDLRLHLTRLQRAGHLEKAIGERRLAVVDVGDDGEITDIALVHLGAESNDYSWRVEIGVGRRQLPSSNVQLPRQTQLQCSKLNARNGALASPCTQLLGAALGVGSWSLGIDAAATSAPPAGMAEGREVRCSRCAAGSGGCSCTARGSAPSIRTRG